MTQRAYQTREIQGLMPAVEPTQTDEIFVLRGENYVFDSKGPKSAFGDRFMSHQPFLSPEGMSAVRVKLRGGDKCFYFSRHGIYDWQEGTRDFRLLYRFTPLLYDLTAWSVAYVNGYVFMNHPSVGILAYEVDSEYVVPAASVGAGVPSSVLYIAANQSRLIAVTEDAFHYSAQGDGFDFAPRLGFAGFQLIKDLVPGSPLGVVSFPYGCLTWTTGGLIRSEFRGDAAVYAHDAIDTQFRPINSHCIAKVNKDASVILDERGLFTSEGGAVTPYDEAFNEFFIGFVRENSLALGDYARLEWDETHQHLYVSLGTDQYESIFDIAFVYYPAVRKWGQMNHKHHAIVPIEIPTGAREISTAGIIDDTGRVRMFTPVYSRQAPISARGDYDSLDYVRSQLQPPTFYTHDSEVTAVSSRKPLHSQSIVNSVAGYVSPGGVTPQTGPLIGLGSSVKLGFFRAATGMAHDELSELHGLTLRSRVRDPGGPDSSRDDPENRSAEDYDPFNVASQIPKFDPMHHEVHGIRVAGSIDGTDEFTYAVPHLARLSSNARFYSFTTLGIWHSIELYAVNAGEAFAPTAIVITATPAGTL